MDIEYLTVKCVGFISYCDALIAKKMPNNEFVAYFISLVGSPSNIQALSAMLFKNEYCKISTSDEVDFLPMKMGTGAMQTIRNRKIENTVNKVMVCTKYFHHLMDSAIVFGPNLSVVQQRAFLCLDSKTSIPLKQEWQEWLWDELMCPDILYSLGGDEMREAYLISLPADQTIQEKVLEAIRMGYLT